MIAALLLATGLQLHLAQPLPSRDFSIERSVNHLFRSDAEATNFGAHVGWSLLLPVGGYVAADRPGLYVAGSAWLTYSIVNEFAMHGPEGSRERALDLVSRLVPCATVMIWTALRANTSPPPAAMAQNP